MVVPYTIKELGHLIQVCHKNGVSKITLEGGVILEFSASDPAKPVYVSPKDTVEMEKVEQESEKERSAREAEDELSRLQVDDPVEFENLLVQREVSERGITEVGDEVL